MRWYTSNRMLYYVDAGSLRRVLHPGRVPCRYCGAEPDQPCTKMRRGKWGKVKVMRIEYHSDRCYDARLATEAVNALDPH